MNAVATHAGFQTLVFHKIV